VDERHLQPRPPGVHGGGRRQGRVRVPHAAARGRGPGAHEQGQRRRPVLRRPGARIDATVLSCDTWTAGRALAADRFGRGRVSVGGDAAHLFTPAGGLGYNTAVEDAVNLGWKLAAAVKGVAGPRLLESYESERRPAAVRNTGNARAFAESLGRFVAKPGLEDDGPLGEDLRRQAGDYLERHGRAEFDIPGMTFGTRYDDSPVVA
jgi:2-polyprenyl-6-methoxyphenol hydroxylase-like FAD-dependent oxidoreductase